LSGSLIENAAIAIWKNHRRGESLDEKGNKTESMDRPGEVAVQSGDLTGERTRRCGPPRGRALPQGSDNGPYRTSDPWPSPHCRVGGVTAFGKGAARSVRGWRWRGS